MSAGEERACEQQSIVDDLQVMGDDLSYCFDTIDLKSIVEAQGTDQVADFLKFISTCIDLEQLNVELSSENVADLTQELLDLNKTDGSEDDSDILETIRRKADECDQNITEVKKSGKMDELDNLEKRKKSLEWLLNVTFEQRTKLFELDTYTYVASRRWELARSIFEKSFKLAEDEKMDQVSNMSDQNDDLKNKMDKMPIDECIALVRSEAEKFESQIEESEGFMFRDFVNVEDKLIRFIWTLYYTKTSDDKELISQKTDVINYIRELQTKLDKKRLD